jgi:hypothetical protein
MLGFEAVKHLTTLSAGSLVLIATFLDHQEFAPNFHAKGSLLVAALKRIHRQFIADSSPIYRHMPSCVASDSLPGLLGWKGERHAASKEGSYELEKHR